jgi:hypothetical protein
MLMIYEMDTGKVCAVSSNIWMMVTVTNTLAALISSPTYTWVRKIAERIIGAVR